jgi:hypothetical protein
MYRKIKINKKIVSYLGLAILFTLLGLTSLYLRFSPDNKASEEIVKSTAPPKNEPQIEKVPAQPVIKESAYIEVPYTVQAPNKRWDIHEESCEEAAALMYYYFLTNNSLKNIPADTAHNEFLKMIGWQKKNYGKEPDLSIAQFGEFFKSYYGYKYQIETKATKELIMEVISGGHPVIVPVMTHALGNPNYGPRNSYHVLVIIGYDKNGIITNDAGISQGQDHRYTWETLFKAIDAQTPTMKQGREMIYFPKDQEL